MENRTHRTKLTRASDGRLAADEEPLVRGLLYRLLATAYRYPDQSVQEALNEFLGSPEDAPCLADACTRNLQGPLAWLADELRQLGREQMEAEYTALFGHLVHGSCSPYEAEYDEGAGGLGQPHLLADLAAFYRAFHVRLAEDARERADFIAVECEFLAFLCMKESHARENSASDLVVLSRDAQRKFLGEHLGVWVPRFLGRLECEADGFYLALAHLTSVHVREECGLFGISLPVSTSGRRSPSI